MILQVAQLIKSLVQSGTFISVSHLLMELPTMFFAIIHSSILSGKIYKLYSLTFSIFHESRTASKFIPTSHIYYPISKLIMQVKSVDDMLQLCPYLSYCEDEENPGSAQVVCSTCARYRSEKKVFNKCAGVFRLPFVDSSRQITDLSHTNRWFLSLKTNIGNHLSTKTHAIAESHISSVEEQKTLLRDKNLAAAITVVRTAYLSIKLGDAFSSITPRLANLSLAGADLGQKNHSYAFPPQVVDVAANVLQDHIWILLTDPLVQTEQPPWYGIITDKITTGQRTRQMTSVRVVNLSTDPAGINAPLILNIYLGHPVCQDESGAGLAQNIIDLLKEHNISSRHTTRRCVGFSIGGEYVNLGILRHFLDLNLITKELGAYFELWDAAYVIERAVIDGFKKTPVLKKHVGWLQEIVKEVQFGNSYETLLKAAETIECHLLKPRIFKSKKFVVDCEKVYRAFFHNYRTIAVALQAMVPSSSAESCLRHMTDTNFVLSISFLSCLCSVLSVASSNFQRYDGLVNDLFNNYSLLINTLDEISEMLDKEDVSGCFFMKSFQDAWTELQKGEFKGVPTISRNSLWSHYKPLVSENMFSKFKQYVTAIKAGLVKRFTSTINNKELESFAGFLNLLWAAVSPHLFCTTFDNDVIAMLFQMPSNCVDIAASKLCSSLTEIAKSRESKHKVDFNSALRWLLVDPLYFKDLPCNLLDGLVKIITIPVSEAIAETQGSDIDNLHLRYKHTDKDDTRLQKELKVKLMGPEPCSQQGEKFVQIVAAKMASNHKFISLDHVVGPAINNVRNKGYSLPFKF